MHREVIGIGVLVSLTRFTAIKKLDNSKINSIDTNLTYLIHDDAQAPPVTVHAVTLSQQT